MKRIALLAAAVVGVSISNVSASIIDGLADASYGPAIIVQNTQTNFGDSNLGQPLFANGSELNAAYAKVDGSNLLIVLAGNLQSNFNKLEIFIDSKAGGQNKLRGDNPNVDFNGLNRMGDSGSGDGLQFDAGFAADHYITVTGGNTGGGNYQLFANHADILTSGGGTGTFLGGSPLNSGLITGALGIDIAINNSNTAGVDSGTGPSSGAGVLSGVELKVPLSLLAPDTTTIKISAFINGTSHDFLSNQVLGGIGGGSNLGEPRIVNFDNINGEQFFTVVIPEPATLGALAGLALIALRRRA
jgi:hypothetical protein